MVAYDDDGGVIMMMVVTARLEKMETLVVGHRVGAMVEGAPFIPRSNQVGWYSLCRFF